MTFLEKRSLALNGDVEPISTIFVFILGGGRFLFGRQGRLKSLLNQTLNDPGAQKAYASARHPESKLDLFGLVTSNRPYLRHF